MKLSTVFVCVGLIFKCIVIYYFYIALRYGLKKPKSFSRAMPVTSFAILIAARNEEAVIGRLVESLLKQEYPRALFCTYVIPNNCTDQTAAAAYAAGAEILTCNYPVRYKGDALHQAVCQLKERKYDAYVIFDADNVVDKHFLSRINDAFCAGAKIVKGRHVAMNPKASWVAGCYDIYFSGFDLLFNRPRANGKLSAKLVGTGFSVKREVLEDLGGWNTSTIAEDAEFAAQCAGAGYPVAWVPDAVTYDEEPIAFLQSVQQRKRWSSGVMQVSRKMLPILLNRKGGRLCFDMIAFLLMPFAQSLSVLSMLGATAARLAEQGAAAMAPMVLTVFLSYCSGMFAAAFMIMVEREQPQRNRISILLFPLFMATWFPLQILALFHRTKFWKEMYHGTRARSVQLL